ncbi:hypothetical protein UVI_02052260 [Ustilaginoidea virens]|uniref:Flavin-containing monooxygenase n=1 Tax=Ustilaginoidea virens TaxID=1159556 RepID=A0A0A1VAM7_USTVR|nr:hypothetical protein UVI_02052260 [Ustilaginoidea virens]FAA01162.1 TPA: flavin-containing monooxygenase [Ustilaginoidea virens]
MQDPVTRKVAVIGAGMSGVLSAAHLQRVGLRVTVFERNQQVGGIWLYCKDAAIEPEYPCSNPSHIERIGWDKRSGKIRQRILHAPPGPCYDNLATNIATPLVQTTLNPWPKDTPDFVHHCKVKEYVQETSERIGMRKVTVFGAYVTNVYKHGPKWNVNWKVLQDRAETGELVEICHHEVFDAVVVASGHYDAPRIPDIPGLVEAKAGWPARVLHSKSFRNGARFEGQNVLLVGGGVSSTDIAREISDSAQTIYQSTRNGSFDMPASKLPANASRVSEVVAIGTTPPDSPAPTDSPFTIYLKCNRVLHGIDAIVFCTGYHVTVPFLPQYHNHSITPQQADDKVLITDGSQVHNLHQDIFYMPDPTLAFVGIPIFNTTFSLFEFQAIAVAAFLSGIARLPSMDVLRVEYDDRVRLKGYGRRFHILGDEEESYVSRLINWVNGGRSSRGLPLINGHTEAWKEAKQQVDLEILKLRALKVAESSKEQTFAQSAGSH